MSNEELIKIIDQMNEEQFFNLCEEFFDILSIKYMNRVPGIYHPNNQIVEIAQKKGLVCLPIHFYSPVPTKDEIRNYNARNYSTQGINWNDTVQLNYLYKSKEIQEDLIYTSISKQNVFDFFWDNGAFSHSDAAFYYSLIQLVQPKRIIEVGAGNSTKLAINSLLKLQRNVSQILSIVEPYPSDDLLKCAEKYDIKIIDSKIQDVSIDIFEQLKEDDIIFYDGSHVSKYGSDVNYFLFTILPILNKGVFVHIHDIFLPDEMPKKWVDELNLYWNEQYLLHAFLMYNQDFEIIFSSMYLSSKYKKEMDEALTSPLRYKGNGGGSIWLRKK